MAEQFHHEALAESHDFLIGPAFGVKIRSAFSAAHGKGRQCIFKHLLKGQKFQNTEIDRRMKPQAALVGTDDAAHLNAIPAVDMNLAFVIHPGHAELNHPLRLHQSFQNSGLPIIRIPFQNGLNRFKDFFNRLMEFVFVWIPVFHVLNDIRHD